MVQSTVIFKEVGLMKPIIIKQLLAKIGEIGGKLGCTIIKCQQHQEKAF